MRVLFFIGHDGFIRNFERLVHELVEAGHSVHLAAGTRRTALMSEARSLDDLCEARPAVTFDRLPKERSTGAAAAALERLTAARSYLRFLGPEYANAPQLRARAERYVPPDMLRFLIRPVVRTRPVRRALDRLFLGLIESLPTNPTLDDYIARHKPDVVLLTPLISMQGMTQESALASARRAGIPTALLVHSWDNLTNKGLIHALPDRVAVWNEAQKQEAVELHRVPKRRVVVTGAHSYDHWFDWRPSTGREEFCRKVGLDPERPFLVYMCSSTFIAPDEVPFVKSWVSSLRSSSDERVRNVGVLVRPHPQNTEQWSQVQPGELEGAVVYPDASAQWSGSGSRADYYDSMHHAVAVVGVNTTALIESAIQERPVLTWLAPEFRDTQEGTLHFRHIAADDGLLLVARSFAEHEAQLGGVLSSPDHAERSRRFVERFVRPFGIDVPGTPRLLDAIVELAGGARAGNTLGRKLMAALMWPVARLLTRSGRRVADAKPERHAKSSPPEKQRQEA